MHDNLVRWMCTNKNKKNKNIKIIWVKDEVGLLEKSRGMYWWVVHGSF
jgi:hypothetical protein